ncbi:hypothetical protein RIF25_10155 [Thermosynechococcaceae cyanobacterium BACA0444]|uniref:Uncharacterized protein n=1 Tax=Pseudocalidococcus azoricus BACA0444 TaxID=2918990 RepID=A0AAE4FRX5_9CYAN|nr:hypothetical protein [Pseudocalidococcus azoricus]MDS3861168.1 hypothetical protein [Pseudocalidococcus azoricus BACA0444]
MGVPSILSTGVVMDSSILNQIMARLSHADQIRLLVSHPFFTGRCPQCHSRVPLSQANLGQAQCTHCGWLDLDLQQEELRDDSITPSC